MSRMKPMSSIRSASSRTRISTGDRSIVRWPTWSSRRPGVATTISGPGPQRADLGLEADAAVDRGGADRAVGAVGADALLDLERELAGRGEDEDADRRRGRRPAAAVALPRRAVARLPAGRALALRRWRIGSTNAAVLPVPVWAPASRSRPASTSGIASRWTGVGSV